MLVFKKKYAYSLWMLIGLISFCLPPSFGFNDSNNDPKKNSKNDKPVADLLQEDGTLDLTTGYAGTIDMRGFQMSYNEAGEPIFVPELNGEVADSNDQWCAKGDVCGANKEIQTMAMKGDTLYVGGSFETIGGMTIEGIARWAGGKWDSLGAGVSGPVIDIFVKEDTVYVGGAFVKAGGIESTRGIAKWTGEQWFSIGGGVNGNVNAITMKGDTLYIGGDFTEAGGIATAKMAQWAGNQWLAMGTGMNHNVLDLAVKGDTLYVGGFFTLAGGVAASRVAQWAGGQWHALGDGVSGQVSDLAVKGDTLYVGGFFSTAGGMSMSNIAQWAGSQWHSLGTGANGTVSSLFVKGDTLYVGGSFTTVGGIAAPKVAQWAGGQWLASIDSVDFRVSAFASKGDTLYVGGLFSLAGNIAVGNIAQWADGSYSGLCQSDEKRQGANAEIFALAVKGDTLYAAGDFTLTGGTNAYGVAQWAGGKWHKMGTGTINTVHALAVKGDTLYAAGSFSTIDGVEASRIAQWVNGTWSPLGEGVNSTILTLVVKGDTLFAAGHFTEAGGIPASRVAQWSGGQWHALGTGLSNRVEALAIKGDTLYAGGVFTMAGGINASRIAQWANGQWSALGTGLNASVSALAVLGDTLYVGGGFNAAGGISASSIAKWTGGQWHSLGIHLLGSGVKSIAVKENAVYVGGLFKTNEDSEVNLLNIGKLEGNQWSALGKGIEAANGMNIRVGALAFYGDTLIAGGSFARAGGKVSLNIATWKPKPTLNSSDADNNICIGDNVTFTASGGTNYCFIVNDVQVQNGASNMYSSSSLNNGDRVKVRVTDWENCSITSEEIIMTVGSVGGTLARDTTVCNGTNTILLSLTGHMGTIQKWQSSTDMAFSNPTDINHTNSSYTAVNVAQTTYYRVEVKNGNCASANSTIAKITVGETTVGGNISGSTTACPGINSTTLTLSGHSGTIIEWQSANNTDFSNRTDINNKTNTYTATNLTETTYFRVVIGQCNTIYSDTVVINVYTDPIITARDTSFCSMQTFNLGTLINGNPTGTVTYGSTFGNYPTPIATDVTVSSDTTFYIQEHNTNTGCTDTARVVITFNGCECQLPPITARDTFLCTTQAFNLATLINEENLLGTVKYGSINNSFPDTITTDVMVSSDTTFYILQSLEGTSCTNLLTVNIAFNNCQCIASNVIYVDSSAMGMNNGLTWTDAFTDLQSAIDLICGCSDKQIWVAKGSYYPTKDKMGNATPTDNKTKTFYFECPIQIYGGFAGGETSLNQRNFTNNKTILSGDFNKNDILITDINHADFPAQNNSENAYTIIHTFGVADGLIIDGFYIQGGNASGDDDEKNSGGAWYNQSVSGKNSNPSIQNCMFEHNRANNLGGAMVNISNNGGNTNPNISNCSFNNNRAATGGAILNVSFSTTESSPKLNNCRFSKNKAQVYGGGMANAGLLGGVSNPMLINCIFTANKCDSLGGGILNLSSAGTCSPILINNLFNNNSAGDDGGAIYNGFIQINSGNNLVPEKTDPKIWRRSKARSTMGTSPSLTNCTFYGNTATRGGMMFSDGQQTVSAPTVTNCIIWDNGEELFNLSANPTVAYSIIKGASLPAGTTDGGNNKLNQDPLFVDTNNEDFSLQTTSPAINMGNNTAISGTTTDLAGNTRIQHTTVDMGAYEQANILAGGTLAGSATVCSGTNSTNLSLSGHSGTIAEWQSSLSADFSSPTTIAHTSASYTATNLTQNTYFRVKLTAGASTAFSSHALLTVMTCNGDCDGTDITENGTGVNNHIASDTYWAANTLTSTGVVPNGNTVLFKAGQSITLNAGFQVESGAAFTALIENCPPSSLKREAETALNFETHTTTLKPIDLKISPNPFTSSALLSFDLTEPTTLSIHLFDQSGRLIKTILPKSIQPKGAYQIALNANELHGGMYYIRLSSQKVQIVKKVILIKNDGFGRGDD